MKKPAVLIALLILIPSIMIACSLPTFRAPTSLSPEQLETAVQSTAEMLATQYTYETLAAQVTALSQGTLVASLVPASTATAEPVQPTSTLLPSSTPFPSLTPFPSMTSQPYYTPTAPATVTPPPIPCNMAAFIADVSVPDGTKFWPNETFTKAWRLKNVGSCTWTPDYAVVFADGDALNGPDVASLNVTVQPGQMVDLVLGMKAPSGTGTYVGYWKLRSSSGTWFGTGTGAQGAFTTNINVVKKPTFDSHIGFNLTSNFCAASWSSSSSSLLYCPGVPGFTTNIVYRSLTPKLEGNHTDDEPALIMVPSDGSGGMIQGRFPAYKVQDGDHFTAKVGCLDGYPKCNVKFQLAYVLNGHETNLGSWLELPEGYFTDIDKDLSGLTGKSINLILRVYNNNGTALDDRAFWLMPVVRHAIPPTAVPTLTFTPTVTHTATAIPTHTATFTLTPTATAINTATFTPTPTETLVTIPTETPTETTVP